MPHAAYRLPHRSTPPARRSKAFDNAILRAFLRAAAIAFALGSETAARLAYGAQADTRLRNATGRSGRPQGAGRCTAGRTHNQ
ncbi:hypothetical protein [Denitromonas iodatirespirans]|uniref:Uncharacterized protein n=1 Tax=Denitromonas iodatirespirans TaxID=2795389 RepID=A0A944HAB8_DENI1|nr:hypothetical protein [Denitromonas iodatirespirans]MBT0964134.1 hypothetical protein [Denitromonas iodatirespirans]